ncbi:MAG TPA: acyltransferase domain-containing protein, partial [Thermoanaerobaculia bacterium]|nr:acyltransferase domain-containing protein [Thermoanaerobaculia bacterium]
FQLLLLSARTAPALDAATDQLARHLEENPEQDLADVAYTLCAGRHAFSWRRALLCRETGEAARVLREPARCLTGRAAAKTPVFFLFPGQGSEHLRMAAGLYEAEAGFRASFDRYAGLFRERLGVDLGDAGQGLERTDLAQAALFTVEMALAETLLGWGVRPEAMIGHSVGEYAAACVAGIFEPAGAVELIAARGRLMAGLPPGGMLAIELPEEEVVPLLGGDLDLAAVNGPRQCTASGPEGAIDALRRRLLGSGVRCHRLAARHAFHSRMVDPLLASFRRAVEKVPLASPRIPFVSNVTGEWITAAEATSPDYWVSHLRRTVRFGPGLEALLASAGAPLVEVGPGRVLGGLARQHPMTGERAVLPTLPHPDSSEPAARFLLHTLGRLWLEGVEIDGAAFYGTERRRRVPLPTYPFERRRYWIEPPETVSPREAVPAGTPSPEPEPEPRKGDLHARPAIASPYAAPGSETESRLAGLWGEVLAIERVGVEDNFFDLGGHSLLAIQLASRIREVFAVDLLLGTLSEAPTIARLARWIDEHRAVEEKRGMEEVLAMLSQLSDEEAEAELLRRLGGS